MFTNSKPGGGYFKNNQNKGFTLVELIAVVAFIAIIILIATPNIINQIRKNKETRYNNFIGDLCLAAETYINHTDINKNLQETNDYILLDIQTLMDEGYVRKTLINPKTNESVNNKKLEVVLNTEKTYTCDIVNSSSFKLTLSKETYIEGFDGWTLYDATVDSNDVLTYEGASNKTYAVSPYYNTNGGNWYYDFEVYVTNTSTQYASQNKGGYHTNCDYYNENKQRVVAYKTYSSNGNAPAISLNVWNSSRFNGIGTGDNAEKMSYLKIIFQTSVYSAAPIKIRNFKVHGDNLPSSFYLINVNTSSSAKSIKYAEGKQVKSYFKDSGTVVSNSQIRVTENGIYTVYAIDNSGNEAIERIEIDRIN